MRDETGRRAATDPPPDAMTVGLEPTATFSSYRFAEHPFRRPVELDASETPSYPVVIVGAGPTGMTLALDLGLRGVPVVVLDRDASIGASGIASRGIAYSKRSLEILDRLGIAERIRARAVTWNEGRIYHGLDEILHFTIQPEPNQKDPAFRNLQQFYVEQYLTEGAAEVDAVDLRWHSRVSQVEPGEDVVTVTVETPAGEYRLRAQWLVCCEGAGSATRRALGLDPPLVLFEDYWAIVDVRADLGHVQRKFWLDSPLLDGGAQIMHGMADGVVRTDWQISQFPDPEIEITPARVDERLRAMLGPDVDFEVVSISRWRFRRRIMGRFVHGRLLFAGDAAHEIPPYGARGGNGGIQDADNLGWQPYSPERRRTGSSRPTIGNGTRPRSRTPRSPARANRSSGPQPPVKSSSATPCSRWQVTMRGAAPSSTPGARAPRPPTRARRSRSPMTACSRRRLAREPPL